MRKRVEAKAEEEGGVEKGEEKEGKEGSWGKEDKRKEKKFCLHFSNFIT